jgi:hypothetical protein
MSGDFAHPAPRPQRQRTRLQAAPFPKDNVADEQRDALDDACWRASEDLIARARLREFKNSSCTVESAGGGRFGFDAMTLCVNSAGALLGCVLLGKRCLKWLRKVPSAAHGGLGAKALFVRMGVGAFLIVQLLTELMNVWVVIAVFAVAFFVLWILLLDGCVVLFPARRQPTVAKPKVFVIGLSRTGTARPG